MADRVDEEIARLEHEGWHVRGGLPGGTPRVVAGGCREARSLNRTAVAQSGSRLYPGSCALAAIL